MIISSNESSEKLKILVAEENKEACSALEELLKFLGHSVMVTQDGEDALNMYHETIPDLVFSGLTLPKLGGMELLRDVKSGSGKTLFVMICPMSDPEKIQQALKKVIIKSFVVVLFYVIRRTVLAIVQVLV